MSNVTLAVLVSTVVVLAAPGAEACSCFNPGNDRAAAKRRFDESDAVFLGRMIRIEHLETVGGLPTGSTESGLRVTFRISKALKGPMGSTVEIATVGASDACGMTFEPDTDYVVFAEWNRRSEDFTTPLAVNKCNGTNALADMKGWRKEWLAFLNELPDLRAEPVPGELHKGGCASCSSAGSGLSAGALLAVGRLVRRRRPRGSGR